MPGNPEKNGQIVKRCSVCPLNKEELALTSETETKKRVEFTTVIHVKLGDSFSLPNTQSVSDFENHLPTDDYFDPLVGVEEFQLPVIPDTDCVDSNGKPLLQQLLTDMFIHKEILLPHGEELLMAKILSRSMDDQGRVLGKYRQNHPLSTLIYDVEFSDGNIKQYSTNMISENILVSYYSDGYYSSMMSCIVDHKCDAS